MKRTFDEILDKTSPSKSVGLNENDSTSPSSATGRGRPATSPQRALISETPPKISRKVKACTSCKKLKIKCDMPSGQSKCVRCTRQNLECIVNRSLQTILDDDLEWKQKLGDETSQLQQAVQAILCRLDMGNLQSYSAYPEKGDHNINQVDGSGARRKSPSRSEHIPPEHPSSSRTHVEPDRQPSPIDTTRDNSQEPQDQEDTEDKLVDVPMSSLYEVTKLRTLRIRNNLAGKSISTKSRLEGDFISKGVISLEDAEELFQTFARTLNHYLWGGVALVHSDLTSVRQSSSLLASSILAVTTLHSPEKAHLHDRTYDQFLNLVAATMFDSYLSLDDIRAFCIGAFWLSDLSWKLSGHAVRAATEMSIHRFPLRAIAAPTAEHHERARLWYLLYLSDHHFSIAYNRPPVIAEDESIRNHELFLKSPLAKPEDFRIVSQVALFSILSRMYKAFGPEIDDEIPCEKLRLLHTFNTDLDNWRQNFQHRLPANEYVASYPEKGVSLHYFAAKLQLNWCALRGMRAFHNLSAERKDFANRAIAAATSTLKVVLEEPDIRSSLVGVPLYLHTNIAMAASFLMKVAARWSSVFKIDDDIWNLVERIIVLMKEAKASSRHIVYAIASGLDRMLIKCREWKEKNDSQTSLASNWENFLRAPEDNSIASYTPSPADVEMTSLSQENMGIGYIPSPGPEAFGYAQVRVPLNDPIAGQFITDQYYPIGIYDFLATQMPG